MASVISDIRAQFPALNERVYGKNLVYFDNAATSQRLKAVTDLQSKLSVTANANIHRAVHSLSSKATEVYESAREAAAGFISAPGRENVVITSGTTSAINTVAHGFARAILKKGDKVLISEAEHHSNIVSWQLACDMSGAEISVIPVEESGELSLSRVESMLDGNVKILAVAHVSNVLGIENPIAEIIRLAHSRNVPVLIDGAQGIVHKQVDVRALDCDFYAFSTHKLYGPTGVGILYGKKEWLDKLPPMLGGGDMVETVTFSKTTFAPVPLKFEAGTPNFLSAAAMTPALEFAAEIRKNKEVIAHERALMEKMEFCLGQIPGLHLAGACSDSRIPLYSFSIDGIHPEDAAQILDKMGVAVRSGLMCAEPIVKKYSEKGLTRVSLLPYNTEEEIDIFADALSKTIKMLS